MLPPRWLTMEDYYQFVFSNLKLIPDWKTIEKQKSQSRVNVRFKI